MILTDTHTHLYADEFTGDRELLIREAIDAGVSRFFLPNIDRSSVNVLQEVVSQFPNNCFPMMGLHPCSVKANWKEELESVQVELEKSTYYALGEIGIDLYWDKTFVKEQEIVFIEQVKMANDLNLPIVIHSRESFEEIYKLLLSTKKNSPCGIFHCFTGNIDQARHAIDLGFYLGIGGVVTFKNSGVDRVVEQVDLHHLVLETDAPYLAPVPFRGKRNLPVYILKTAEKIAAIKNVTVEEVAAVTTENSKKIFGR